MATWHCGVCGSDFSFHSELDWHMREAHGLELTAGLAGQLEREAVLDWAWLRQLQSQGGGPSVSLLLWTRPAAIMAPDNVKELHHLAALASRELAYELKDEALAHMDARLGEAVRAAENSPTDHGLAVFVSDADTAVVPLPFSPRERAVVNHTFATRDLLATLQLFPMYRVLVLSGPGFRLLEGRAERLVEITDWKVPNPSVRRARQSAWTAGQRQRAAFAAADRAIGERVAVLGRLPLVLVGRQPLLDHFSKVSPHTESVVGQVPTWGWMVPRESVAHLAGPVVHAWREEHTKRYLEALAEADRAGDVVWGLHKVWGALVEGRIERLWVESSYSVAAKLVDHGKHLVPGAAGAPGVLPDVIDSVIERAALAGAHVETAECLGVDDQHRIAAQLKPSPARDLAPEGGAVPHLVGELRKGTGSRAVA